MRETTRGLACSRASDYHQTIPFPDRDASTGTGGEYALFQEFFMKRHLAWLAFAAALVSGALVLAADDSEKTNSPFASRKEEARKKLVEEEGGTEASEAAVARGLEWLALHQAADGHWGLHDFNKSARESPLPKGKIVPCNCATGTQRQNDVAGTALALLPFLGAGHTHKPDPKAKKDGPDYTKTVDAGLKFLMAKQSSKDGSFSTDMYAHGIATIALCEAYGMTQDKALKPHAQKALDFIVAAQDPDGGGWRYKPKDAGDTSVTGWQMTALKSGQMAGLTVPQATLKKCEKFLDSVQSNDKGGYSYMPNSGETPAMTAVGLLCRQYLGVNPKNPGLLAGVDRLKKSPPGKTNNLYYEYYATQVMHHMGGDSWKFWNEGPEGKGGMRDLLIKQQDVGEGKGKKHQVGSWASDNDPFGKEGGRIMTTSLSLLTLEVYYRHAPLFRRDEEKPDE
jgi:hypothetical protein